MTTAHRPTWKAAVGRANQGGWEAGGAVSTAKSALEAPGQLSLKFLPKKVDKKKALKESLLALEKAEIKVAPKRKLDPAVEARAAQRLLKQTAEVDVEAIHAKYDDSDVDDDAAPPKDADADDTDLDDSDSDLDDDSDDEDDEEALQAELAKIRAEREEARRKATEEEAAEEREEEEEAALLGNPLLSVGGGAGGASKRRWNEDVVFRNQAKGEPKMKKRFINDTVRNDFHKRFLNKFIR
jgi:protein CWC15